MRTGITLLPYAQNQCRYRGPNLAMLTLESALRLQQLYTYTYHVLNPQDTLLLTLAVLLHSHPSQNLHHRTLALFLRYSYLHSLTRSCDKNVDQAFALEPDR